MSVELIPSQFRLDAETNIEARDFDAQGRPTVWCVKDRFGSVLNKDSKWEWEPSPSNRDEGFIARTRFTSPRDAAEAWNRCTNSNK